MASQNLRRVQHKLSPGSINAYYRCPRKFDYRYIHKKWVPYQYKPYLAIGGAAHKTVAEMLRIKRGGQADRPMVELANEYLSKETYPEETGAALRAEHLPQVIEHVTSALEAMPAAYDVYSVERQFSYEVAIPEVDDSVAIASRVDAVIKFDDGSFDHIDFKTGSQGGDLIQNVISRVTVKHELDSERILHGDDPLTSDHLRTVVVRTTGRIYEVIPSDREAHRNTWSLIRETISGIATDNKWDARPNPYVCRYCEFNQICDAAEMELPE